MDITISEHSKVARNLVAGVTDVRLDKMPKNKIVFTRGTAPGRRLAKKGCGIVIG